MKRLVPGFVAVLLGLLIAACGGDPAQNGNNNGNDNGNQNHSGLCGDGFLDIGEQCDDGTQNSDSEPDACRTTCRVAYCGDGVLDPGISDDCDDGGFAAGDGCDGDCQVELGWDCSAGTCEEICGDDLAVGAETCDGSDLRGEDCISIGQAAGELACSAICEWDSSACVGGYVCGDGTHDPGEGCDDGNVIGCDGCAADCRIEVCGDFVQECAEVCDDGNTTAGDGCSADCLSLETCGNGVVDTVEGEACDDGGESASCDVDCTLVLCGDGVTNATAGEACDDGNTVGGDLCAANCLAITCPSTSSCVEDPPGTWQGPVALHNGVGGNPFPTCPVSYPAHQLDLKDGLQAPGDCVCSCEAAAGMTCGSAMVNTSTFSSCIGLWDPLAPLATGVCTAVSVTGSKPYFRFAEPAMSGGTCATQLANTLETPFFQDQTRICGGAAVTAAGCQAGEICAPDPGAGIPYDSQLCIFAMGDSLCPAASSYSQRFVHYSGYLDTRYCDTCSCTSPTGSCGGSVAFTSDCSATPAFYGSLSVGQCTDMSSAASAAGAATYTANPTGTCVPSGSVEGAVTETGAVTICCQP